MLIACGNLISSSTQIPCHPTRASANWTHAILVLIKAVLNQRRRVNTLDGALSNWNKSVLWSTSSLFTVTFLDHKICTIRPLPIFLQDASIGIVHGSTCVPNGSILLLLPLVFGKLGNVVPEYRFVRIWLINTTRMSAPKASPFCFVQRKVAVHQKLSISSGATKSVKL